MKDRLRMLRWRIAVPLLHGLAFAAAALTRRQLIALGRAIGALVYLVSHRERRRAVRHLGLAFPSLSSERTVALARRTFDNLGIGLLESLAMHRWSRERLDGLLVNHDVLERALAIEREHNGVVFVTGHVGNWEMTAALYARHGGHMHVVGRRMAATEFDSFLTALRGASGVEVLDRDQSPREMLTTLRKGNAIGILPDQDITEIEGIFVDFFGRPAHTPTAPARLAQAANAPIYIGALVREGERFRLVLEGPVHPRRVRGREARQAEVRRLTEAWSGALEGIIRRYPDQWVWMHRRWRNTPERLARRRTSRPGRAGASATAEGS